MRAALLVLAALVAWCDGLQLAAVRPARVARARPVRADATDATDAPAADYTPVELTEDEKRQIEEEKKDPLQIAAGGDSDFVRWYRFEKAKEEYLKENPNDVLANAFERLKGPISSLVILTAGFYSIPLIRGVADGIREGDVLGTLSNSLANPTDSVKF